MGRPDHRIRFYLKGHGGLHPRHELRMYEIVDKKTYDWREKSVRDLVFVDVFRREAIRLLIDGSSVGSVRCAQGIGEKSRTVSESPMRMRFGVVGLPIAFELMRRMHTGLGPITVPMGWPSHYRSCLEPLAPPG